jgi:hypothetical protein
MSPLHAATFGAFVIHGHFRLTWATLGAGVWGNLEPDLKGGRAVNAEPPPTSAKSGAAEALSGHLR